MFYFEDTTSQPVSHEDDQLVFLDQNAVRHERDDLSRKGREKVDEALFEKIRQLI